MRKIRSLRFAAVVLQQKFRLQCSLDRIGIDTAIDERLAPLFHGAVLHRDLVLCLHVQLSRNEARQQAAVAMRTHAAEPTILRMFT